MNRCCGFVVYSVENVEFELSFVTLLFSGRHFSCCLSTLSRRTVRANKHEMRPGVDGCIERYGLYHEMGWNLMWSFSPYLRRA
jgi:hypothetical protein